LGRLVGTPPRLVEPIPLPPSETTLSVNTLKLTLGDLGMDANQSNLALAEALAKLGVPLTEANLSEGQMLLARSPGVSPAVFALTKALDLPPTSAILNALGAVVGNTHIPVMLDQHILHVLSLLPEPSTDTEALAAYLTRLVERISKSTENSLYLGTGNLRDLISTDARAALLDLAQTSSGGHVAASADHHAASIEGQQLLNQLTVQKFDPPAPLYFTFPFAIAEQTATCEVQVFTTKDQQKRDAESANLEEYLRTTIRVKTDRLGVIDVALIGMWSGRLQCMLSTAKNSTCRLLRKECPGLAKSFAGLGWKVEQIVVERRDHFVPLWLGGNRLDNPRPRLDKWV
jgi:hypothetical protein